MTATSKKPSSVPAHKDAAPAVRQGRVGTDGLPLHQRLIRREARIWPDQRQKLADMVDLAKLRRTSTDGERITDATLTRVGIDVLCLLSDDLTGNDEAELGAAVTGVVDDLLRARDLLRAQWPEAMDQTSVAEMVTFLLGVAKRAKASPKMAK
ncbi:hypothetical protein [Amycolatopsis sp. PS_44_ISF1]|uniref:hypothetical protein n=1 Tax=Amycolatopsis sp. PS_44_ISF1 TaxID=2974917 RepID=UPI0028DE1428|nr:hypothetical protein [Amycolatopsis sp. PS_44_ISF1]MDT8916224.1 hypothetical protein [Amycolatopsis sp. PS_44_ISF1]